jgi:hypothetical protein
LAQGQDKKRLAPDGVNIITDRGDGIVSSTLIHAPTRPLAYTHEDYVRDRGQWPISKSEAEEIVRALAIIIHDKAPLTMEKIVEDAKKSQPQRMREQANAIEKSEADYKWAKEAIKKWQGRAVLLRD